MIVQIYSQIIYNFTKKEEIENRVYPEPIVLEFKNEKEFSIWRRKKELEYREKYNKGRDEEDYQLIEIELSWRKLL